MSILKDNVNWYNDTTKESRVLAWWSGGVASAIACKIALETYENVHLAFCDTGWENSDTFRFMEDFEKALGVKIHKYKSDKFTDPEDVWRKGLVLNFAGGARCSGELKRDVRVKKVQDIEKDYCQIFGFDFCKKEINRAENLTKAHPEINPKFPLIEHKITRDALFKEIDRMGIEPPEAYKLFLNNNCIGDPEKPQGGCIQGGAGYWQKIREVYPMKFKYMANIEHEITELKKQKLIDSGKYNKDTFQPVTLFRDSRKKSKQERLFLVKNPLYPEIDTIDIIKGIRPIAPMECNGFCSIDGITMFEQELF